MKKECRINIVFVINYIKPGDILLDKLVLAMSLKRKLVEEIHRSVRRVFPRSKVLVKGVLNDLYQADLVDMRNFPDKGFHYLLTVIDVGSKRGFAEPIKRKTGAEVVRAMKLILAKIGDGYTPRHLQTDKGTEFYNADFKKLMKNKGINLYSSHSELKASVVERFNRTLKGLMWKEMSFKGSRKWVNMIPELLEKYNNRVHRSIGMKPSDVTKRHEKLILNRLNKVAEKSKNIKPRFKLGDRVRITKQRNLMTKGYLPGWTNEQFIVVRRRLDNGIPSYNLQDVYGVDIKGRFYEQELMKTNFPDRYLVEKIVKRRGDKVLIRWLGFSSDHDTWENVSNVEF